MREDGSFAPVTKNAAQVIMGSTDLDVVERFADICGCGAIYVDDRAKRKGRPHEKTFYRWVVSDVQNVREITAAFLPWFGERRADRALEILERTKNCRGRGKDLTHCIHGHEYTPENTYRYGPGMRYRQCRICQGAKVERRKTRAAA